MKKTALVIAICLLISNLSFSQSSVGLSIQAGGFFPIGNFGNVYETGLGGNVGLHFALGRNFQLGINGGYVKYNFNTTGLNNEASKQAGNEITIKIDAPLTIIPIMLSGRYIFESSRLRPYITGELGAHVVTMDFPKFTIGNDVIDPGETASDIAVGWGLGVGFLLKLDRNLFLDISGKLSGNTLLVSEFKSSNSGDNFVDRSASWISAMAGIYFAL